MSGPFCAEVPPATIPYYPPSPIPATIPYYPPPPVARTQPPSHAPPSFSRWVRDAAAVLGAHLRAHGTTKDVCVAYLEGEGDQLRTLAGEEARKAFSECRFGVAWWSGTTVTLAGAQQPESEEGTQPQPAVAVDVRWDETPVAFSCPAGRISTGTNVTTLGSWTCVPGSALTRIAFVGTVSTGGGVVQMLEVPASAVRVAALKWVPLRSVQVPVTPACLAALGLVDESVAAAIAGAGRRLVADAEAFPVVIGMDALSQYTLSVVRGAITVLCD